MLKKLIYLAVFPLCVSVAAAQVTYTNSSGSVIQGANLVVTNSIVASPPGTLSLSCPLTAFAPGPTSQIWACSGGNFTLQSSDGSLVINATFVPGSRVVLTASGGGKGVVTTYHYALTATISGSWTLGGQTSAITGTTVQSYSSAGTRIDNTGAVTTISSGTTVVSPAGSNQSIAVALSSGGAATDATPGSAGVSQDGYAVVTSSSANSPFGTAVFSLTQNGVVVSEAGVPASPPTLHGRIFIDFRTAVSAASSQFPAGTISIDTGVALVNRGTGTAHISFSMQDATGAGVPGGSGAGTLAQGAHTAVFIDQLGTLAAGFSLPASFSTTTMFGSLDISSDQLLSILALHMTVNQRGDVLMTSTPMADMTQPASTAPLYFPQFADGGGYNTMLILLNSTNSVETGKLDWFSDVGSAAAVQQVGGNFGSTFPYSIPAGGIFVFQTAGLPSSVQAGSVQAIPDTGSNAPVGAGVFSLTQGGALVTRSGIPSAAPTTHARIYVDTSGGHDTGLAIANPSASGLTVTVSALADDGVTPVGTSNGPVQIPADGHAAAFAEQFISGLPAGFTGVLDVSSPQPFAALTVRSLTNARGDMLFTTFPIADFNQTPATPLIFPQIADGGGYQTQFIFLSTGGASIQTINFFGNNGLPIIW